MAQRPITTGNGQIVPAKENGDTIKEMMDRNIPAIIQVLPKYLDADRFMGLVFNEFNRTPKLLQCTPTSLVAAVRTAAAMGLEIGISGESYLVPYGDQVQLIPGYRGLMKMAYNSGRVALISHGLVYKGDVFSHKMTNKGSVFEHEAKYESADDKDIAYAYVIIRLIGVDEPVVEVMPKLGRNGIDAVMARSAASRNGPWQTDYAAMATKTVLRRALKFVPTSPELQAVIGAEEYGEAKNLAVDYSAAIPSISTPVIGESNMPESESVPVCPVHDIPWRDGQGGSKYHPMPQGEPLCNPGNIALQVADSIGWTNEQLNEYLKENYGAGYTRSKVTIDHLPEIMDFLREVNSPPDRAQNNEGDVSVPGRPIDTLEGSDRPLRPSGEASQTGF